jgi:hypothetical protein
LDNGLHTWLPNLGHWFTYLASQFGTLVYILGFPIFQVRALHSGVSQWHQQALQTSDIILQVEMQHLKRTLVDFWAVVWHDMNIALCNSSL